MNKKQKIIYASDTPSIEDSFAIIKEISNYIGVVKLTASTILCPDFHKLFDFIKSLNLKVFLDLKVFDIPNTVYSVVSRAIEMGADIITISGALEKKSLESAVNAKRDRGAKIEIFATTILTSFDASQDEVLKISNKINSCNCDGVVCSAAETRAIKEHFKSLMVMNPGIRLDGKLEDSDDQKRHYSPQHSINEGSDYIVIGRPISKAENKKSAAIQILNSINNC